MVVLNNSPKEQTIDLARFAENIEHFTKGTDILSGEFFDFAKASIMIKAKTPLIIELQ